MTILAASNFPDDLLVLRIDHDPTVTPTDAKTGSLFVYGNRYFRKLDDGSTTNVAEIGLGSAFGTSFQSVVNNTRTSTTGEDTVRISLTTPAITGTYLLYWTATVDSNNKIYEISLYNSTDAAEVHFDKWKTADADYRHVRTGFYLATLTGSAKTFQLRWGNEPGMTDEIFISNARLVGWRVS